MTDRPTVDQLFAAEQESVRELTVDRLIVREELIVSDTGEPWEKGFEQHQIPRGAVIRSLAAGSEGRPGVAGIWVRSRLIKSEIDDPLPKPAAPRLVNDDGSGPHRYSVIAVGPQGDRSESSEPLISKGLATLEWDSVPGADAYVVVRDGEEYTGLVQIEGSNKQWTDRP